MLFNAFIVVFDSGIRLGTPLILACLAGLWSERSGVFDIALEGKMLVGAFASAAGAAFTGSVWAGLLAGVVGDGRRLAGSRLRLDRSARQSDRLRHRDQYGRRRPDRVDRQRDLVAGRAHRRNCSRAPVRRHPAALRQCDRRGADLRAGLPASDLRPRPGHLRRLPADAADLLGALQHPVRPQVARGRRESGSRRHRRHIGARPALRRGDDLRRAGRDCRASIWSCRRPAIFSRT